MELKKTDKKRLLARLRRAEGQLAGIGRMIEDDKACVDTLIQISAIQGALGKIGKLILTEHVESCVADALQNGNEEHRKETIDGLIDVFSRFGGR